MTALLAADPTGPSSLLRRRRLGRGMAAAGALSVAVHAAVLLGRLPSGSSASNAAPPAPVLLTRRVAVSEPSPLSREEPATIPVPTPPTPTPVEPAPPADQPRVVTVQPTVDREALVPIPPASPPPPTAAAVPKPPAPSASQTVAAVDASPIAAPPAPVVTYQGSMGLNPPPRPLGEIDPLVPEAAGSRGGVVVLRLFINEHGSVDKAEVLSSTPPGLFDASALEAFTHARFSPGYFAGVAVKSQLTFEVKYRALGSGAEAAGRTY